MLISTHRYTIVFLLAAPWLVGCQYINTRLNDHRNELVERQHAMVGAKTSAAPLSKQQQADIQVALAASLESHGEIDKAIKVYQEVLKKDDKRADAYHRLAVLCDRKGDAAAAESYFKTALKKAPQDTDLRCDYGYSCYLRQRWQEAESNLRQALTADPTMARAHNNLGLVLAHTHREDAALAEFARAGCNEAQARANLAFALMVDKRWLEAQREYELALTADPNCRQAKEGLATLASLDHVIQAAAEQSFADETSGPNKARQPLAGG